MPRSSKSGRREYGNAWYAKNKERIKTRRLERVAATRQIKVEYYNSLKRTLKCIRCGFSDYRALQFHHRDKSQKDYSVSNMLSGFSIKRIQIEIDKCDVLCANCHLILHAEEKDNIAV